MATDPADAVHAAVADGTLTDDSARAILRCIDADGCIDAPNDLLEGIAREVIEAAGVEFRLPKRLDLRGTPGETERTGPETSAPDDDRPRKAAVSASSRGSQRPQKRRKCRKRTEPPSQQAPAQDRQEARQADPSTRSETPAQSTTPLRYAAARSRAAASWAEKHRAQAAAMLARHPALVGRLLAEDATSSADTRELIGLLMYVAGDWLPDAAAATPEAERTIQDRALRLASRLPSTETGHDDKPLSLLAAVREALGADRRAQGMIPPAPRVRIVEAPEDRARLPILPTQQRQLTLPNMSATDRDVIAPAAWLRVFDRLGGNYMAQGRGVPVELRLFVEALAWAPPAARRGVLAEIELTVRDLVRAVWPNGWQRGRDLPKLVRGIDRISAFGVLSDGRFRWRPLWFQLSPDLGAGMDDPVRLYVQLPAVAGAGAGARFHRDTLRRLGLHSAPAYRLYLALVEQWDRKLRRGLQPYTPEGANAPVPLPGFGPAERRRLIFGQDVTGRNESKVRYDRDKATERAFMDLTRDGVIELRHDERDPRIYRPRRRDLD